MDRPDIRIQTAGQGGREGAKCVYVLYLWGRYRFGCNHGSSWTYFIILLVCLVIFFFLLNNLFLLYLLIGDATEGMISNFGQTPTQLLKVTKGFLFRVLELIKRELDLSCFFHEKTAYHCIIILYVFLNWFCLNFIVLFVHFSCFW